MQHSHGVQGSETSLLQCFAGQFSLVSAPDPTLSRGGARGVGTRLSFHSRVTAVSSEPKASWVVVMYTMHNHILTTRWSL